jgi:hypothetical protein
MTSKLDYERILLLLGIVEKSVDHPDLKPVIAVVNVELTEIREAAIKEWEELQKAVAEKKAKEEAEAAAKAKAEKEKADAEEKKAAAPHDEPEPVRRR